MTRNLLDESAFCQNCGLCCQGQIYNIVFLTPEEVEVAKTWPVELETRKDGTYLSLQCGCFHEKRCTVYSQRPKICADYKCHLLEQLEQKEISQADALKVVTQALELTEKVQTLLNTKNILESANRNWSLPALFPTLKKNELDPDILIAVIALDALLTKHFRNPKDKSWFNINEK